MSLRDRLVDDWHQAWRWWSVRAAVVAGAAAGALTDPNVGLMAVNLLYAMPPEYRWFVPPLVGFAVAAIPIALRLWRQGAESDGQG